MLDEESGVGGALQLSLPESLLEQVKAQRSLPECPLMQVKAQRLSMITHHFDKMPDLVGKFCSTICISINKTVFIRQ